MTETERFNFSALLQLNHWNQMFLFCSIAMHLQHLRGGSFAKDLTDCFSSFPWQSGFLDED